MRLIPHYDLTTLFEYEDIVLDTDGYHTNRSPRAHDTVSSRDSDAQSSSAEKTPGPSRKFLRDASLRCIHVSSGSPSPPSSPETYASDSVRFPPMRATSEPPPDTSSPPHSSNNPNVQFTSDGPSTTEFPRTEVDLHTALPPLVTPSDRSETEAYMWEWGGFPQKTPVQTTFVPRISLGAGDDGEDKIALRRKGKDRLGLEDSMEVDDGRSSDRRFLHASPERSSSPGLDVYGTGGRLFADHRDPKKFKVLIEGRTIDFELSIVDVCKREEHRTRPCGPLGGNDEVEDAQRFEYGKISFAHFMADENIVKDKNLVLKWAGDQ